MEYGYPPEALRYDARTQCWRLDAEFDASWMMWHIETAEEAMEDDWQSPMARATRDSATDLPLARLRDAEGEIRAQGVLSGDLPLVLQRAGARAIRLERLEIDGALVLYVPSDPLEPGRPYLQQHAEIQPRALVNAEDLSSLGFFAAGTMIATKDGAQPVDWLRPGDMILTRDNGYQPILHLAQLSLARDVAPEHRPLQIAENAFGAALPERALSLTAGTQILLASPQLELWFGEAEMFARADQLDPLPAPDLHNARLPDARITGAPQSLWAIVLMEPEVILAEGLWIGSALASPPFLAILSERARKLLAPVVTSRHRYAARACLKDWEIAMFKRQIAHAARVAAA